MPKNPNLIYSINSLLFGQNYTNLILYEIFYQRSKKHKCAKIHKVNSPKALIPLLCHRLVNIRTQGAVTGLKV